MLLKVFMSSLNTTNWQFMNCLYYIFVGQFISRTKTVLELFQMDFRFSCCCWWWCPFFS